MLRLCIFRITAEEAGMNPTIKSAAVNATIKELLKSRIRIKISLELPKLS